MDVGGNDGAAACDLATDEFGFELFALGDKQHFFGDEAEFRQVHLRHVAIAVGRRLSRFPLFNRRIAQRHEVPLKERIRAPGGYAEKWENGVANRRIGRLS